LTGNKIRKSNFYRKKCEDYLFFGESYVSCEEI